MSGSKQGKRTAPQGKEDSDKGKESKSKRKMAQRAKRLKTEADFNEKEYAELRRHYMEPVVTSNAELAMCQRLRRQTRPPRIEQDGPGWRELRKRVRTLEKVQAHEEIHRLLKQLRDWELCPPSLGGRMPEALSGGAGMCREVAEVIDISDETVIIDVDTYILEVLIVREVKPDPEKSSILSQPLKQETAMRTAAATIEEGKGEQEDSEASSKDGEQRAAAGRVAETAVSETATAETVAAQKRKLNTDCEEQHQVQVDGVTKVYMGAKGNERLVKVFWVDESHFCSLMETSHFYEGVRGEERLVRKTESAFNDDLAEMWEEEEFYEGSRGNELMVSKMVSEEGGPKRKSFWRRFTDERCPLVGRLLKKRWCVPVYKC